MPLNHFNVTPRRWFRSSCRVLSCFLLLLGHLWIVGGPFLWADPRDYIHEPYEASQYVPPPPPQSKVHLTDNQDGTLTDNHGLMWTLKDSYADLGGCLNWYQSYDYVKSLKTGGYNDWRMPTPIDTLPSRTYVEIV